jgi:hypothetical protein
VARRTAGISLWFDMAGVLVDDAARLARQAATADVEATLDITPGVPRSPTPIRIY